MVSYEVSILPTFLVSKILGLYPYGNGELSPWARLYSLTITLFNLGWYFSECYRYWDWRGNWSTGHWFFAGSPKEIFTESILMAAMGSTPYVLLRNPQKMQKVHQSVELLVDQLGHSGYSALNLWILLICVPVYLLIPQIQSVRAEDFNIWVILRAFKWQWCWLVSLMVTSQLLAHLEVTRCLFRKLNNVVTQSEDLESCIKIHDDLCSQVREFSSAYLISFLVTTYEVVVNWMNLAFDLMEYNTEVHQITFSRWWRERILFNAARFAQWWAVCFMAYEVSYESDAFNDALCRSMRKSTNYNSCLNNKLMIFLSNRPSVQVSPELFCIDTAFMIAMLSVGIGYILTFWDFR